MALITLQALKLVTLFQRPSYLEPISGSLQLPIGGLSEKIRDRVAIHHHQLTTIALVCRKQFGRLYAGFTAHRMVIIAKVKNIVDFRFIQCGI